MSKPLNPEAGAYDYSDGPPIEESMKDHLQAEVLGGVNRTAKSQAEVMMKQRSLSPACGYEGEHYHAPGVDPNCLSCTHPPEDEEPEPLPVGQLRVEGRCEWDAQRMTLYVLEVANVPTEEAGQILMTILPKVLKLFLTKNRDYQSQKWAGLGSKGHFVDIWRKVGKLRRGLWEDEPLFGEGIDEIIADLIGHCLCILNERNQTESARTDLK